MTPSGDVCVDQELPNPNNRFLIEPHPAGGFTLVHRASGQVVFSNIEGSAIVTSQRSEWDKLHIVGATHSEGQKVTVQTADKNLKKI